jgi:hypothetical protein
LFFRFSNEKPFEEENFKIKKENFSVEYSFESQLISFLKISLEE